MEIAPILYFLAFCIQLILGTRIYLLNPGKKIFRLNAVAMFIAAITIFIEYEIAKVPPLDDIILLSAYHSASNVCLIYVFCLIARIFANPFKQYRIFRVVISAVMITMGLIVCSLVYQLLFNGFRADGFFQIVDGQWTYKLMRDSIWSQVYMNWNASSLFLISLALFFAWRYEESKFVRFWKLILFSVFTLVTVSLFVSFIWNVNAVVDHRGSYTLSPFLVFLTFILSLTFTNFKLFELTPANALDNILESMTNLVIITDKNFKVRYVNSVVEKELILSKEQMFDKHIMLFFRKAIREEMELNFEKLRLLKSKNRFTQDFSFDFDGEPRHYQLIITPIDNERFIRTGFTFVGINLTDVKENQAKLEESNRHLERFAYIASHDLKSPLRNVVSFLGLIKRRLGKNSDQNVQEYLDFATSNAQNMYNLIEDILEFSRMRKERSSNHQMVDLNHTFQRIEQSLNNYLDQDTHRFSYPELPSIEANNTQMIQLFQNLIENGFKYNKNENPEVVVTYQKKGSKAIFRIQDNGIGIDPAFHENIFEVFKRLHTSSEYSGSGVGLAICKHIIEQHQGKIHVESENGQGTAFIISLPLPNTKKLEEVIETTSPVLAD